MADDSVGLLDALGIDRAHVCGISMGGMIAQTVAIRHPSRVASLISMASTTGNPEMPQGTPEAVTALLTPLPEEREAAIKHLVEVYRILAGPNSPFDVVWTRSLMTRVYERSFYPPGRQRQLVANMASGNRKPALARVTAPTLVIHGADDPIIPVEHGKDTAEAIPGAELLILEGLGHLLHFKGAWPRIVEPIAAHTKNAA
jgi:pimeloyl-ACP methyl ester carboxylesterase